MTFKTLNSATVDELFVELARRLVQEQAANVDDDTPEDLRSPEAIRVQMTELLDEDGDWLAASTKMSIWPSTMVFGLLRALKSL